MEDQSKAEIKAQDEYDYAYWADHYGVTVEELKAAIEKVGNDTGELTKYFEK